MICSQNIVTLVHWNMNVVITPLKSCHTKNNVTLTTQDFHFQPPSPKKNKTQKLGVPWHINDPQLLIRSEDLLRLRDHQRWPHPSTTRVASAGKIGSPGPKELPCMLPGEGTTHTPPTASWVGWWLDWPHPDFSGFGGELGFWERNFFGDFTVPKKLQMGLKDGSWFFLFAPQKKGVKLFEGVSVF